VALIGRCERACHQAKRTPGPAASVGGDPPASYDGGMTIVLREMTRDAADAILAGERPGNVRVADDYPTEFSAGVAQVVGAEGQFGPFFLHRTEDDLVVGEIGGAFVDEEGTIEIGYAVVESEWNRGYATAAVEAFVTKARVTTEVRRIVAHTPLERPESGRVLDKAGFAMVREIDDTDETGNVLRVNEWELEV
jgi:RimJ/RimL family protein N-acetyltransferase